MENSKSSQLTARAALLIAAVSLGLSGWAVGCRSQPSETTRAEPASGQPEHSPKPVTTTTAEPEKSGGQADVQQEPKALDTKTKPGKQGKASPEAPLHVKRLVVTSRVEEREPVESAPLSAAQGPVVAFVELANESAEDQFVIVTFEHEGTQQAVGHIKLKVPAGQPRWRTWGRTRMVRKAGQWVAVVRTEDGRELQRRHFEVQPA